MTAIDGIVTAIETAAPQWKVEIGFATDVSDWVEANRSTGRTILVTLDGDEPRALGENNKARGWRLSMSIWMRTRADARRFLDEVLPTYKAVRGALDGLAVTEDGQGYIVTIGAGRSGIVDGYAIPTLQLSVG